MTASKRLVDDLKNHDFPHPQHHDIAYRLGWGWVCWSCRVFLREANR